jgi:hypothetical protein
MTKCTTCGGTYTQVQPDGTQYFHACPPVSDAEVIGALGLPVDRTLWAKPQADAFAAASRVRLNARDENLPGTRATDKGLMKAPGKGTTTIPDPVPPTPLVLP